MLVFVLCVVGFAIFRIPVVCLFVVATAGTILIGITLGGRSWGDLQKAMGRRIGNSAGAVMIIVSIGMVIGSFVYSGTIPMLIYYGTQVVSPQFFYVTALLACMMVSMFCGSSWTTVGTIGLAVYAMAQAMGMDLMITIGAIWCGAVFGDSCSPVSDGPNLASAAAGADLYDAIKNNLLYSFVPAYVITIVVYFVLGMSSGVPTVTENEGLQIMLADLDRIFNFNILLLIPFLVLALGIALKKPAAPTLVCSAFSAVILGAIFQPFGLISGLTALNSGFSSASMITHLDVASLAGTTTYLLNRGGMSQMMTMVLIILMAQIIIAVVEDCGFMDHLMNTFFSKLKSRKAVMLAAIVTGCLLAPCGGNAYCPQIITGSIFQRPFLEHKLDRVVLARILLAVPGVFCSFWPWLLTPMFYNTTFGVTTIDFMPYMVVIPLTVATCLISAFTGWGVKTLSDEEAAKQLESL